MLRALDQEVLTFLSFTEATGHTFEDFSWKLHFCFEHLTREMGGKVPQGARITDILGMGNCEYTPYIRQNEIRYIP